MIISSYFVGCRGIVASGSSTRLVPLCTTKVKAHKSVLFSEGALKVKIKNTCLI